MAEQRKILKQEPKPATSPMSDLCSADHEEGGGLFKLIPLTQGKFAIVDAEDYKWLMQWKWHAWRKNGKALRGACRGDNKAKKTIVMHRVIMKAPSDKQVDHKNHNVFDNRKRNLRICTNAQNSQNRLPYLNKTSKYKGVSWNKRDRKWQAVIQKNDKQYWLGYFESEIKAAESYDKKAKSLNGEFAYLNFPSAVLLRKERLMARSSVIQVIRTFSREDFGTPEDPCREVVEYFDFKGGMLFRKEPDFGKQDVPDINPDYEAAKADLH